MDWNRPIVMAEDAKIVPAQDSMDMGQGIAGLEQPFRQFGYLLGLGVGGIEWGRSVVVGPQVGIALHPLPDRIIVLHIIETDADMLGADQIGDMVHMTKHRLGAGAE